jgi:hypothetical protein
MNVFNVFHILAGSNNVTLIHRSYGKMKYIRYVCTMTMVIMTDHRFCGMMANICKWNGKMWFKALLTV